MKTNIANILSWIFFTVGIIFLVWKIIGGSPTEFGILVTLIMGMMFKMMTISKDVATVKERTRNLENKFNALASDFKDHIKNHK